MIGWPATINHLDRDNIWYQTCRGPWLMRASQSQDTGDPAARQLASNPWVRVQPCLFLRTNRCTNVGIWWGGHSIDNSAYSLSLYLAIKWQVSLLREINSQCVLALTLVNDKMSRRSSHWQERVAPQKSWKIFFCEFVTNLGQFQPCWVSSSNRAKRGILKCRTVRAVKSLVQYLGI